MTRINQATIDLVKRWEGFKPDAYLCPAGKWTIGYGITAQAGIGVNPVRGMRVTQAEADVHLARALEKFASEIRPGVKVPINENEFGAFVSLAYNIGPPKFLSSSALRHFNAGDKAKAAGAIKLWNKAKDPKTGQLRVVQGLVNRRADEVALFWAPVAATRTAPAVAPVAPPAQEVPGVPSGWLAALISRLFSFLGKGGPA
jgi:lysozyme